MFAKHKLGAACLQDYKDVKSGAIVPIVNELYAQVEEWLESNEWEIMPDVWPPKTYAQELAELNAEYIANVDDLAEKITKAKVWDGANEDSKVAALRSQKADLDTKYISDLTLINQKWSN